MRQLITRLTLRLGIHELVAGSALFLAGTFVVNICNYLFHLFMARLLGVVEYGELQSLLSVLVVFGIPLSVINTVIANYAAYYQGKGTTAQLGHLWRYMSKFLARTGVVAGIIALIASLPIASFLQIPSAFPVMLISGIVFVTFLIVPSRALMQGTKRFGALALNAIVESVIKLVVGVLFAWIGWGLGGAIGGVLLGLVAAYTVSLMPLKSMLAPRVRMSDEDAEIREFTGRELARYSWPVFWTFGALTLFYSTDVILAKHFLSPDMAGQYSALAITGRIIFFVTGAVATVMFSLSSELRHAQTHQLNDRILRQTLAFVGMLCAAALVGYVAFPWLILDMLVGAKFLSVAPLMGWFGFAMCLYSLINVLAQYFLSLHRTGFVPILILAALAQVLAITLWHETLAELVVIMNVLMAFVFVGLLLYYGKISRMTRVAL